MRFTCENGKDLIGGNVFPDVDPDSDSPGQSQHYLLFGSNVESHSLCSGCCAERSALTQLRVLNDLSDGKIKISQLILLTDAPIFISPGGSCREFITEHFNFESEDVPIYLLCKSSADKDANVTTPSTTSTKHEFSHPGKAPTPKNRSNFEFQVAVHCIRALWPYPSLYRWTRREEQVKLGMEIANFQKWNKLRTDDDPPVPPKFRNLYKACLQEAEGFKQFSEQKTDEVHPILYSAGMEFDYEGPDTRTLEIVTSSQLQSMEFPLSVCAISSGLLREFYKRTNTLGDQTLSARLLMIDQFGTPHAPHAAARAWLVENGWGDRVKCVVTEEARERSGETVFRSREVWISELYNAAPKIDFTDSVGQPTCEDEVEKQ